MFKRYPSNRSVRVSRPRRSQASGAATAMDGHFSAAAPEASGETDRIPRFPRFRRRDHWHEGVVAARFVAGPWGTTMSDRRAGTLASTW